MNINAPDPASLLMAQLTPVRPQPSAPGAPVQATVLPPGPGGPVVIPASATAPIVSVDPLAALLQIGADETPETPIPTADLARRYAESGTLSQQSAKQVVQPQAPPAPLGATDAKLLAGVAQAYRQEATATPLPQAPNVLRELANASLPNAPGTAGNAPAVIVIDGRSLAVNPAQTAALRDAIGSSGGLDPRALANILKPMPVEAAQLTAQPASALKELATAQIAQAANIARQQAGLPVATPAPPPVPANPAASQVIPAQTVQALASQVQAAAPAVKDALAAAMPQLATAAREMLPAAPATPVLPALSAAAIVIDGRTIALTPAQVAVVRANLGPILRLPTGPAAGSDAENPLVTPAVMREAASTESKRVQVIDASARLAVETSERHERPQPQDIGNMLSQMKSQEKVEAVRAVRADHVTPYEPQLITPSTVHNPHALAPAPDHVILAGHAPAEAPAPAIASIVIGVAPGITRDDVTAEIQHGGYRISFAGSTDTIMLHAGAGLQAQLIFADGTSLRLQLNQD